ncbi:DNA recombination and repair protein RecO [uncultured Gammaproteobacteria bacterium]|nr:DNA recombination and repair protein RecO [uncultured Gammaproteobacteria bacterium]
MTKIDLTPAFLIHRRAFKDSSLLLDFFTQEHGKIRLVGRGLRKSKTPLQMFQHMKISFAGKGELKTLTTWEADDEPRNLQGETLILGIYINELVSRLLQEQDPHAVLFDAYKAFISQIAKLEQQARYWSLRLFENNLLSELGYGYDLENDIHGDDIAQGAYYQYQSQSGFVRSDIGKISGNTIQLMLAKDVLNMPDVEQLKLCRNLNRERLQPLLGNKPLQSRSLFFTK